MYLVYNIDAQIHANGSFKAPFDPTKKPYQFDTKGEAWDHANELLDGDPSLNLNVYRAYECRGKKCEKVEGVYERYDAYGISTGHWCDTCYDSSAYPYRKDKYYDYLNAGEYLDEY